MMSFFPEYFEWWHIPLVFLAGLVGETYGCMVGGGSLVIQPVLLAIGIPPAHAIATDIAGAVGSDLGIIHTMGERLRENLKMTLFITLIFFIGGVIGTYLLHTIDAQIIIWIMCVAVVVLLGKFLFISNQKGQSPVTKNDLLDKRFLLLLFICFFIGIYSNFISIGEGTFFRLAAMATLGMSFTKVHGIRSVGMLFVRGYSLAATATTGYLLLPYFLTLFVSNFIAGKIATKLVFRIPELYLRALLCVVSLLFLLYLVFVYKVIV